MGKFVEVHGMSMAEGSYVENFIVESLSSAPSTLVNGRSYYDEISKRFKFVIADSSDEPALMTIPTKEEVYDTFNQNANDFASTDAGKGSGLIGFVGKSGVNDLYSVAAGTLEASVSNIITKIDDLENNINEDSDAFKDALASTAAGESGARLVGYEGITTTNSNIVVEPDNTKNVLDFLAQALDTQVQNVIDNYLNKTDTLTKTINGEIVFTGPVKFQNSIDQTEDASIAAGETVTIADNNILLNSDLAEDTSPTENAGISVNRGTEGEQTFIQWNETDDLVEIAVKQTDGTIILLRSLSKADYDDLVQQINELATAVANTIGNIDDLTTPSKTNIVSSINSVQTEIDEFKNNLSSLSTNKGTKNIGYKGKTGSNNKLSISEADLQTVMDNIIQAIDTDRQDEIDWRELLANTDADKGIQNIGYKGKTGTNELFSIAPADMQAVTDTLVTAIDNDRKVNADNLRNAINDLKNAINNSSAFYESDVAADSYTWAHGLNSENIMINIWVYSSDDTKWVNDVAAITIIDANNVQVDFSKAVLVRIVAKRYDDL